jgi:hypothetical protein
MRQLGMLPIKAIPNKASYGKLQANAINKN